MFEKTVDILLEPHDRSLFIRLVPLADRLRASVSIPIGDGREAIEPDEVELEISHAGGPLEAMEKGPLRQVRTRSRGVTAHFLQEFALPPGVQVGDGKEEFLCTVTFRGNARSAEVML